VKEDFVSRMQQASAVGVAAPGAVTAPAVERPVIAFKDAFLVALAAGLGYGFDAYAVNIFGIVGPLLAKDFGVTAKTIGLIGSIFLVGYTIGTVGFGILADRIGRRPSLGISILLYGITTSLGGTTGNLVVFSFLRFLTGIGGAGELAVGAPYTAEMWPKNIRALGTGGVMFSLYSLGYICAAAAALMIVPHWGWRWAFGFALVPAILVFLFRQFILESERYKLAEAEMSRLSADAKKQARPNIWTIPGAKRRIVVGWLLYTANACGYWGITVFLTTFMVAKFKVAPTTAIFYALVFYIVQFFLSYVGTGFSDFARSRRLAGIVGAVIMIACTILAATSTTLGGFLIYGAIMIGMLGWLWGVSDTYMSEFFRTTLRGTGFGIMVGGGRTMSIFAPFLVGWGIATLGPTIPFLATAGLWVLTIIGYAIGPETAGRELEEVQL
jgi:putative MFS transporter